MTRAPGLPPGEGSVQDFFRHFFQITDTPEAHGEYTTFFLEDADFAMASQKVKGRQAVLELRKSLWKKVAYRHHVVTHIFPADYTEDDGRDARELMLRGRVDYGLKDGGESSKEWGAYAKLSRGIDGEWKFAAYQVYLDTAS